MGHGHNCTRHGYVETANCPSCDADEQRLREEGFAEGYDAGWEQAIEVAAKLTVGWLGDDTNADPYQALADAMRKLKGDK